LLEQETIEPYFTYGDYVLWQGDERWELIDGKAFLMSPSPSRAHQSTLLALARQIADHLEGQPCDVYVAPFDVRFPKEDEPDSGVDTVLQPDLVVVCDPSKLDKAGCRGAPDWVIEILSPSTSIRDRKQKRDVYERHGVREYWVVDPETRTVAIHRLVEGSFAGVEVRHARGRFGPSLFPDLSIRWDRAIG